MKKNWKQLESKIEREILFGQVLIQGGVSPCANVVVPVGPAGSKDNSNLWQPGKEEDPEIDKYAPEVIIECCRVLQPEDEDVSKDHDEV